MEKWKKRSLELIISLLFGGKKELTVTPYYPQKTEICGAEEKYFKRTVPEKKGISSRRIYNMLCELEGDRRANVHSLLVLCGGDVICECSAPGYSVNEWQASHSLSKTVCGMIIGRLVDEGMLSLDTRLVDVFPEVKYKDKKFPLITIEHLLSMTSGVDFAEAGSITESDWTSAFFAARVRFIPGTKFAYNSMNSYILARTAERVTGRSFGSLAEAYIFSPLGIKSYLWEKGPEGTEKGGWGLYMSPESWAKVGYMLLSKGAFNGKMVLSKEWISLSATVKAISPRANGNFNYAYHMWTGRDNGELLFNGMLGQNVWICPKNDIIAVITSGNNEFFQDSPALEIIRKNLGGNLDDEINYRSIKLVTEKQERFFDCRRWVRPLEERRGLIYLLGLKPRATFDNAWTDILGSYAVTDNNISVMPLILRVIQNNLNNYIEQIELLRRDNNLVLVAYEGGQRLEIIVGLYGYVDNVVELGDEKYIIRALGEAYQDFHGKTEFRIELILPETSNTRMIVIQKRGEGRLSFKFSERPNHRLAENVLKKYREAGGIIAILSDMLERRIGKRELEKMIDNSFSPVIEGVSTSLPDYKAILNSENESRQTETSTVKIIRALVNRFFSEHGNQ